MDGKWLARFREGTFPLPYCVCLRIKNLNFIKAAQIALSSNDVNLVADHRECKVFPKVHHSKHFLKRRVWYDWVITIVTSLSITVSFFR